MLKKVRIVLAAVFFIGITLLLAGVGSRWLGWMAKLQFLPAVLSLNVAVIVALVLLTLLFGRVYCSVICPLGILQDIAWKLPEWLKIKRKPRGFTKELKWLRYAVWALYVAALLAGVHAFVMILAPYSAYGRIVRSIAHPLAAGWTVLAVAAISLLAVTVLAVLSGRLWCNALCPVGTTLSFLSRFAMFRPVIDAAACKNCHKCENNCKAHCIDIASHSIDYSRCVDCFDCLEDCKFDALHYRFAWKHSAKAADSVAPDSGRRAFVTASAMVLGSAALNAQGKKVDGGFAPILPKQRLDREVPLTPPGSASVKDFYSKCTACQLCVSSCPNNVLRPSKGLEHIMQPEMGFENGYCRPECTVCSEVCPTGAIVRVTREEKTAYHVGVAVVDRDACISSQGKHCGNCARHCPTGALKMTKTEDGMRIPVVEESVCIGCGACENLCPVRPVSAIIIKGRYEHKEYPRD